MGVIGRPPWASGGVGAGADVDHPEQDVAALVDRGGQQRLLRVGGRGGVEAARRSTSAGPFAG